MQTISISRLRRLIVNVFNALECVLSKLKTTQILSYPTNTLPLPFDTTACKPQEDHAKRDRPIKIRDLVGLQEWHVVSLDTGVQKQSGQKQSP